MNKKQFPYCQDWAIGVDLGGTKIGFALVHKDGKIKEYTKIPTLASQGKEQVVGRMTENIHQMIQKAKISPETIAGIGLGIPGMVNPMTGIVRFAPNLPGWENVPIAKMIENEFNRPVMIENDANAAAWGEKIFGVARGMKHLVCLTLGTGIGGGLILNGEIYHGQNFFAGEVGHMILNQNGPECNCGGKGCLEAYSSATGIRNQIREKYEEMRQKENDFSSIPDVNQVKLIDLFQQAREGHPVYSEVIREALEYLGLGIVNLIHLLNPQMIVLVGGIANEGEKLLQPIKRIVNQRAMPSYTEDPQIVLGKLGNYAGIVGSAALFFPDR